MIQVKLPTSVEDWRQIFLYCSFFFIPFSIAGDDFATIGLYVTTLVLLFSQQEKWRKTSIDYGLLVYLFGIFAATTFSSQPLTSLSYFQALWRHGLPYLIFLALSRRNLDLFLKILLVSALLISVYGIFQFYTGIDILRPANKFSPLKISGSWHAVGAFSHHLTFGGVLILLFPLFLAPAFSPTFSTRERSIFLLGGSVILAALILSLGRGSWIGATFALLVMMLLLFFNKGMKFFLLGGLLLLALFSHEYLPFGMGNYLPPVVRHRVKIMFSPTANQDRLHMWEAGWNAVMDHPWFGIGPAMETIELTPYYRAMEKKYNMSIRHKPVTGVHNIYLQTWLNYGIFGLIGYCLWWGNLFWSGIQVLRNQLAKKSREYFYLTGALSGLAGSVAAGFFENNFRDGEVQTTIFVVMGIALASIHQIRQR